MNKNIFIAPLLIVLFAFSLTLFIFTPISFKNIVNAFTIKNIGDDLTLNDWNDLPNDFVAKSGDTMTGPLILPSDPNANMQASTKQYVDNNSGGSTFINWGRSDCPSGADMLYNGYMFGKKWDIDYGSPEVLCVASGAAGPANASTIRDMMWPVGTGAAEYTPPGINTDSEIRCAMCYVPSGSCYQVVGNNTCNGALGFNVMYSGYMMGGVTGIANPNNRNQNSRHCINSNFDGSTPNNVYASVYAGTVIQSNSDLPAYTVNSFINCAYCCK